ncbi:MAG: uracil-DNA glycosylase [Nitrospirota bacterium]
MSDIQKEFLDILADVRAHLEYQRALGIKSIELPQGDRTDQPRSSSAAKPAPSPVATSKTGTTPALSSSPLEGEDKRRGGDIAGQSMTLAAIREEIGDCTRCKLHKGRTNIVFGEGEPKAVIVFVGEGPGFEEDQQGRPFVGAAGQLLTDIIEKGMNIKRAEVYICNIVKCRPPNNRNPEPDEVESCIGFVKQQIRAIHPTVIVTLGNVPTQNLLNTKQGITKLRGVWQEYEGIPVMPTFHPSYLLRSPGEKKWVWVDIKNVLKKLGMQVPTKG